MKAVILAAGHGTRMKPYTYSKPKHMLPVANKPVLGHVIDNLKLAGITEILMVVGHLKEGITTYFKDGAEFGVKISYIEQIEKNGLASAVKLSEDFVGGGPFVVVLGDVLFTSDFSKIIREHEKSGAEALVLLTRVENPSAFGVVEMDGNRIKRLVEKPNVPPSNLAIAGVYIFSSNKIFDIIRSLKPSKRGEYEITDALQGLIDSGKKVCGSVLEKWWKDTGNPRDLLETNKTLLDELYPKMTEAGLNCSVSPDSKLIPPVLLGDNCKVTGSEIGPYVCIQKNSTIENVSIKNSIIMDNARVANINLDGAVIGSHCSLESDIRSRKHTHRYYIGDNSTVKISEIEPR